MAPTFLTNHPVSLSPLAKAHGAAAVAADAHLRGLTQRFELFVGGRELANGACCCVCLRLRLLLPLPLRLRLRLRLHLRLHLRLYLPDAVIAIVCFPIGKHGKNAECDSMIEWHSREHE